MPADFETIDEFWEALEAVNRWNGGLTAEPAQPPKGLKRAHASDEFGGRQVGLRLPAVDYEGLVEMSVEYGVAPATMARMLVVRGVRAHRPK